MSCQAWTSTGPSTYGDRIAEVYDEWFPESSRAGEVDAAVSFLRELAAAGPALELGIGTGRVAVPLFTLAYVVFNTLFALPTQDDQVMCFQAVARHLTPDGVFVVEAFVPDVSRFDRGQRVSALEAGVDEVRLEVSTHDAIAQRTESHHVVISESGIRLYPVRIRYAPVAELDLMARLAGLRLRERWADWDRSKLSSTSQKHISVWELDR